MSMQRIIMCGGADAGKSTLIGRLMNASTSLSEAAEAGYQPFAIGGKAFAISEAPGREDILGGLALAATNANLAVIVIDARKGITDDIYRQCHALTVLGLSRAILIVSKMEKVEYSQEIFDDIDEKFRAHAETLSLAIEATIPVSDSEDDDIAWYPGPTLAAQLEQAGDAAPAPSGSFRFMVDEVNGSTLTGTITGGAAGAGEGIVALPSAGTGMIKTIKTENGKTEILLEADLDVAPGDIICPLEDRPQLSDQFRVNLLWQHEDPLLPSRAYLLKMGAKVIAASITDIRHIVNPHTLERDAAKTMRMNDAGACNLALASPIPYDPFKENRTTGGFTLLDKESLHTVATGTIEYGLYRADNIHWHALGIDKSARAEMKNQKPVVLWFTGLSASGKSTIANRVDQKLHEIGRHTYTLDGDNVRHGLNKNLGFTDADRVENIRRVAETSKLMVDAGLICLVSFISPFRAERRMARELMEDGEFIEVFVDASLEVCEARDPKGLYKKARAGEIKNFTGFDSPYEAPEHAEIVIPTADMNPEEAAESIVAYMQERGFVEGQ